MSVTSGQPWSRVKLGEIGDALIGLTYDPQSVQRSGTLVLRSSNIQDGRLTLQDNVYVDCEIPPRIRVRETDILICVRNGSRRLIGKSIMLDRRVVDETFGAFMCVFRSSVNPYLRYFFQSDDFKRQIDEHLGATINQITNGSLNSFSVVLPNEAERATITERLNDADSLISTLERLQSKKQAIKQGVLQQVLTGKTRLPGFAEDWKHLRLGSAIGRLEAGVSVNSGPFAGKYAVLKTSCVSGGRFIPEERKTIAPSDLGRARVSPVGNSLIISRMNTPALVGEVGYVASDWPNSFLPDRLWLATPSQNNAVDLRWLGYVLSAPPHSTHLKELATGTSGSMKNIAKGSLLNLALWCPPPDEQIAIAAVLTSVDDELERLSVRLNKAKAIKQGMMQELLTGRTRLPAETVS